MSGLESQWDAYYEELKEARKSGYRKEKEVPMEGTKHDQGKSRMDLVDPKWLLSVGDVLGYGAEKYAPGNWKKVEEKRFIAAAMRHLLAYMDGEVFDDGPKGSGLPHLSHASTCLMFLHYLGRQEKVE